VAKTRISSAFLERRVFLVSDRDGAGFFWARVLQTRCRRKLAGAGARHLHTKLIEVTVIFLLL